MARKKRIRKSGSGLGSIIALVIICIVLLAGYYFLGLEYYAVRASLNEIHESIKTNVEQPLADKLRTSGTQRAKAADLAYGPDFFQEVAGLAEKGSKYDDLARLSGFEGEDPNALVTDFLKTAGPGAESLHVYVNDQKKRIADLEAANRTLNEEKAAALADKSNEVIVRSEAEAKMREALVDKGEAIDTLKKEHSETLVGIRKNMADADKTAKDARDTLETTLAEHRGEKAVLADRIVELEEIIADLEAKLRETKPVEVAVKEGLVLEVDPVNQSVIINMGQLEGVKMGEYFTVMRIGRGAERIPKAKLKVISVKKTVSVCDIMSMVEEGDFIARRDVIHRDKKTED